MVRFRRIEQSDRIFFVTTNLARGTPPLAPHERDIVLNVVGNLHDAGAFYLFAYVVMPDHLHLLLTPVERDLTQLMRDIKSQSGFRIAQHRKRRERVWQERYFDNIIRRVRHFWEKVEYIHGNPAQAGLVKDPAQWKWSSYRHYAKSGVVPVVPDPVDLPADGNALLWPAPWR
jgi:putative transposase